MKRMVWIERAAGRERRRQSGRLGEGMRENRMNVELAVDRTGNVKSQSGMKL